MKRVIKTRKFVKLSKVIISLLMVGIALSCSNEFEAIEMNKNTMYIPNSGGSDTIKVLNYSKISLTGEAEVHLNDSVYWVSSVQNRQYQDQFEIDGDWFKVIVPYGNPNLIVASIEKGKLNTNDNLLIKVRISNTDVFGSIEIKSKKF